MMGIKMKVLVATSVAAMFSASAVQAQAVTTEKPVDPAVQAATAPAAPVNTPDFTITGSAAIVSQYRFRGISQSDNKPVAQATFTVAHASGFYLSAWGSSASRNDAVDIGGTEIDVYGGYTHALGKSGVIVDAGLYGYIYPGSTKAVGFSENYYEAYASLAKTVGTVTAKAGVNWAPRQSYFTAANANTHYNVYAYGELGLTLPHFPVTFHSHVGHTGGGLDYAGHAYIDYTVGGAYKWKALTFDISFVGTDLSRADTRAADLALSTNDFHRAAKSVVVGSVTASF